MKTGLKWSIGIASVIVCAVLGGNGYHQIKQDASPTKNAPRAIYHKNDSIQSALDQISQQNVGKADIYYNRNSHVLSFVILKGQYIKSVKSNAKSETTMFEQQAGLHGIKFHVIVSPQAKDNKAFQAKEKSQQRTENQILAREAQEARQRAIEKKEHQEAVKRVKAKAKAKQQHAKAEAKQKAQQQKAKQNAKNKQKQHKTQPKKNNQNNNKQKNNKKK